MTIPIRRSCRDRMTRWYHVCRLRLTGELRRLVRSEDEEIVRMKRRLQIHLVIFGCTGTASFLSLAGVVSVDAVTGVTAVSVILQECIDCLGRF